VAEGVVDDRFLLVEPAKKILSMLDGAGATLRRRTARDSNSATALSLDPGSVNSPNDRMVLVAIEPLTSNEPWLPFGAGELMVFAAGQAVWSSRPTARALDGSGHSTAIGDRQHDLVCPA
jgi:predicted glutamine amidotransferase